MRQFLLYIFISSSVYSFSQSERNNTLSIEGAGDCYYGAVKYQRWLINNDNLRMGPSAGLSFQRLTDSEHKFNPHFLLPLGVRVEMKNKWFPLAGLNAVINSKPSFEKRSYSIHYSGIIGGGIRFNDRYAFTIGYVPIFGNQQRVVNWFSVAAHIDI